MINDKNKDDKKDEGKIDKASFKRAIGMIESSGGKYLDSKYSSASGRYHFLYNLIKADPSMKGITKRQFMNDHDLQEQIMDKAIDGKLSGYVGYESHARNLKSQFNTNLTTSEIAALTHFLGAGGVRKYLRDPSSYSVAGEVNASPEAYLTKFRKHAELIQEELAAVKPAKAPRYFGSDALEAMQVKKDGVNIRQSQIRKDVRQGLQFKQNNKIDISALPDAISEQTEEPNIIPLNEQVQGGTPSGLKVLGSMNEFTYGGEVNSTDKEFVEFNEGGLHEENPYGGIPMGVGANGKMNTVEEGEAKFGSYIFSNRLNFDGPIESKSTGSSNSYEDGGDINPTDTEKKKSNQVSDNNIPDLKDSTKKNRLAWDKRYGSDTHYFNDNLNKIDATTKMSMKDIILESSKKQNIDPNFLYGTLMSEGLDHWDDFGEESNFLPINEDADSWEGFPVRGPIDLGLDTIGNVKEKLFKKGYLNRDEYSKNARKDNFFNEKHETVESATFRDLRYGTEAAAAFIKNSNDELNEWLNKNDLKLSPAQQVFFENVAYNAGQGNAYKMIKSYRDKGFLDSDTFIAKRPNESWKEIHKHASRRMGSMIGMDEQGILKFNRDMKRTEVKPLKIDSKDVKLKEYRLS